ncbi:MAG: L-aspartate oxidase [Bacteroidales bacterium]
MASELSKKEKHTDFLVIGSGIAGLSFALQVAEKGTVCIVTKADIDNATTAYAQGGIAAVTYKPDNFEKHIQDTLNAGHYLNDEAIVRMVIEEGPKQIQNLIQWGTNFDKSDAGTYNLHKEGGHSEKRVLHHKDNTGEEIQRALLSQVSAHPNIEICEHHLAIDLITQHHLGKLVKRKHTDTECYGAYVYNKSAKQIDTMLAKITLLATGGCGNVYQTTTNPPFITGDGIAMAYRAKCKIENMEFVQFHPTALYNPKEKPSFLITEAMRGAGAVLRDIKGKTFMEKYDKRASLAPRDIVARAIDRTMKEQGTDHIFLDATCLSKKQFQEQFPNIFKKCISLGINPVNEYIPVVPSAHYLCGGIAVNKNGESSIHRLYAVGETASTGLHGANRLASNSLLEAVVFADKAAKHSVSKLPVLDWMKNIPVWSDEGTIPNEEKVLITQSQKETQEIMSNYVGIVRSNLRLRRALDRLEIIYRENEDLYKKSKLTVKICELRNMINVGYIIIKMAQERKESIGLHHNIDYPKIPDKAMQQN